MDNPIVMTPQEIINVILAICGAIITISGAGTIIIRAITKAREPNKVQDDRLAKLEEEVRDLKGQVRENARESYHQFSLDEQRVSDIEVAQKEINVLILESLQALTDHALDGNNRDALAESKKRIDRYLINKAS